MSCEPQPTVGSIIQELHASDMACTHRSSDIGQRQAASSKACTHQLWRVRISVCQWQAASAKAYTYLTWLVRFGQAMSANDR